jgi:hypothetical protein
MRKKGAALENALAVLHETGATRAKSQPATSREKIAGDTDQLEQQTPPSGAGPTRRRRFPRVNARCGPPQATDSHGLMDPPNKALTGKA